MEHRQQHLLDSLRRSQAFLEADTNVLGLLKSTSASKQLDLAIVRALAHAHAQGTAEREAIGAGKRVERLVADLKRNHMSPLARFSRANLGGDADLKALVEMPHNLKSRRLVIAARALATVVARHSKVFDAAQFPPNSVGELRTAADLLEMALDTRTAALSRRVQATAGLVEELARGREAVAMLDPVVVKRLSFRKDLLAGWLSAKRVVARSRRGPARLAEGADEP